MYFRCSTEQIVLHYVWQINQINMITYRRTGWVVAGTSCGKGSAWRACCRTPCSAAWTRTGHLQAGSVREKKPFLFHCMVNCSYIKHLLHSFYSFSFQMNNCPNEGYRVYVSALKYDIWNIISKHTLHNIFDSLNAYFISKWIPLNKIIVLLMLWKKKF